MDKKYTQYLLKKTEEDYNLLAENYSRTRAYIPDDIRALGEYARAGERALDSGCANGRLFEILGDKGVDYIGIDASDKLIEIAKKRHPQAKFQIADSLNLPFPDNYFDKVYSISVLHNVPSKDSRLQYLKEAKRVLKPEGLLILRAWDFWRRMAFPKLFLKYTFLKLIGKSKLDFKDVFVPWKSSGGEVLAERYFHCFTKGELKGLAKEAGFRIKESWRGGKDPRTNIYLIAEKQSLTK